MAISFQGIQEPTNGKIKDGLQVNVAFVRHL
jgi:hypothetical protein